MTDRSTPKAPRVSRRAAAVEPTENSPAPTKRHASSTALFVPVWNPKKDRVPPWERPAGPGVAVPQSIAATAEGTLTGYTVKGDCMAPTLRDGDTIIVDQGSSWQDGDIVVAFIQGQGFLVKRAYEQDGHVTLRADAPGWSVFCEPGTHIVGVVVAARRASSDGLGALTILRTPASSRPRKASRTTQRVKRDPELPPNFRHSWEDRSPETPGDMLAILADEIWERTLALECDTAVSEAEAEYFVDPANRQYFDLERATIHLELARARQAAIVGCHLGATLRSVLAVVDALGEEVLYEEWTRAAMESAGLKTLPLAEREAFEDRTTAAYTRLAIAQGTEPPPPRVRNA